MASSIKARTECIQHLTSYNGNNPYLLVLKRDIIVKGDTNALNDFAIEYVNDNWNAVPKEINKTIRVADWWGEKKKEDWGTEFIPQKIRILSLLGETSTTYHVLGQYRQSVPPKTMFIPKKAVLTNFLLDDYHNVEVDFERYNNLMSHRDPNRKVLPHQKEAVQFLLSRKKCILADDMGLAKTGSMIISAIEGNFDSVLIICPASLKSNWKDELLWFVPERDIAVIEGIQGKTKAELEKYLGFPEGKTKFTTAELKEMAKERGKWTENRFVIVNYDILGEFYEIPKSRSKENIDKAFQNSPLLQYLTNKKSLVIIDEAHYLSNLKSDRYKLVKDFVKRAKPSAIYLATGTPITNTPVNYYNLLYMLDDPITDDWSYYMKRYCGAIEICKDKKERDRYTQYFLNRKGKSEWKQLTNEEKVELREYIRQHCKMITIPQEPTNLDELKERTAHLYLRRVKEDLDSLTVEKNVHEVFYNFTPLQWAEYSRLWDEYETAKLEENPDAEINKELIEGGIYRKYCSNQMIPNTIKMTEKFLKEGRKVVIICCYDEELYTLRDYFADKCVIYNGKMSSKEKDISKNAFLNDEAKTVFIGNLKSCGVGLTLISSNVLLFNSFSYSRADNIQAEDRIFRIGQKKNVDIYYQMFIGTQHEKVWNIQLKKDTLSKAVIKKEDEK